MTDDALLVTGAVFAGLGIAGYVYVGTRRPSDPPAIQTVSAPSAVDATTAARPLGPTLPLIAYMLAQQQSFAVAGALGNGTANLVLDTATSIGLAVPELYAHFAGFQRIGSASVSGVGSSSSQAWSFLAPLTLGGYQYSVQGLADPNWSGQPLLGMPFMQHIWPNGFTVDTDHLQVRPVTTPYAAPQTYAPTLPLWRTGLTSRKELIVAAKVGASITQAVMDTGNQFPIVISPALAKSAHVQIVAGAPPYSPPGSQWFTAPIAVGGRVVTVKGVVNPAWSYIPLLGVPFWRAVYPKGWAVNLVKMRVQPL